MKIAVVTPYFPTSTNAHRGHSAYQTLRCLKRHAEIEVICPLTAYPKWLTPKKYSEVADLTYQPAGFKTTYFEYPAIPLLTRPVNGLTCARLLLPYVRSASPDIILNYWIYPEGFSAVRVGATLDIPVVVAAIGSDICRLNDPLTLHLVRKTLMDAAAVITVSEDLRRRALRLGVPAPKVTTILNGCDTSIFYPGDRDEARRAVGCDGTGEVILYAGSLFEAKGLGELISAFAELVKSRPSARLVVIGAGIYGDTLANRVAAAGVQRQVLTLGRQSSASVAQWMRASDVFCLPSHSEGCPNVIVEALACGRPIVATNVGGIPELVTNACGILVPPHDHHKLHQALSEALSAAWDRDRIAAAFRRSWEEAADETLAVCDRVLKTRGTRPRADTDAIVSER